MHLCMWLLYTACVLCSLLEVFLFFSFVQCLPQIQCLYLFLDLTKCGIPCFYGVKLHWNRALKGFSNTFTNFPTTSNCGKIKINRYLPLPSPSFQLCRSFGVFHWSLTNDVMLMAHLKLQPITSLSSYIPYMQHQASDERDVVLRDRQETLEL